MQYFLSAQPSRVREVYSLICMLLQVLLASRINFSLSEQRNLCFYLFLCATQGELSNVRQGMFLLDFSCQLVVTQHLCIYVYLALVVIALLRCVFDHVLVC